MSNKNVLYSLERTIQSCMRTLFALLIACLRFHDHPSLKIMLYNISILFWVYYNLEIYYNYKSVGEKELCVKLFVINNTFFFIFFYILYICKRDKIKI